MSIHIYVYIHNSLFGQLTFHNNHHTANIFPSQGNLLVYNYHSHLHTTSAFSRLELPIQKFPKMWFNWSSGQSYFAQCLISPQCHSNLEFGLLSTYFQIERLFLIPKFHMRFECEKDLIELLSLLGLLLHYILLAPHTNPLIITFWTLNCLPSILAKLSLIPSLSWELDPWLLFVRFIA
jgi:hypothetical protein